MLYRPTGCLGDHNISGSARSNTELTDHVISCDALIHYVVNLLS